MALDVNSVQYVAPVFTPRDKDGRVNFDIIPLYVEYLIHNGVQGLKRGYITLMLFYHYRFYHT